MAFKVSVKTEYIPKWGDNEKNPNPMVVEHYRPSHSLRNDLIDSPKIKVINPGQEDEQRTELEVATNHEKIVRGMVTKFRNFTIDVEDSTGKVDTIEIKNVYDLFGKDTPPEVWELVSELGNYFQGLLSSRIDSKN